MQIPLVGLSPEQAVACAIYCCDKQPYDYEKMRDGDKTCQRIGSRKHSCVLHALRQRTKSGKLTSKNRKPTVLANPPGQRIGGKNRVPDTIIKKADGWHVIDAKFPCDTDRANAKLTPSADGKKFGKGKAVVITSEGGRGGADMIGDKEEVHYAKYKVGGKKKGEQVKSVKCMTPKEAEGKKGDCSCTKVKT